MAGKNAPDGPTKSRKPGAYSDLECEKLKAGEVISETLRAVIGSISSTSEQLLMSGLNSALENGDFIAHLDDGIVRYLYAAAFLSFAGKDISKDNLANVIKSLDVEPDDEFMDIILATKFKSHLAYIYTYYFLLVNGMAVTEKKLIATVKFLGIKADRETAAEVLKFVQK
jgi:ribosomal protein L12E/L44/L45/RPP1/RPP2